MLLLLCNGGLEHLAENIILLLLASDEGLACSLREVSLVGPAWNDCIQRMLNANPSVRTLRRRLLPELFKRYDFYAAWKSQ
jgi:hypothetical protein